MKGKQIRKGAKKGKKEKMKNEKCKDKFQKYKKY